MDITVLCYRYTYPNMRMEELSTVFLYNEGMATWFILTRAYQKIKPYFAALILIITTNFAKKCFSFYHFSFEYKKKEKYTLNSNVLQYLLERLFNYSDAFYELYELCFYFHIFSSST